MMNKLYVEIDYETIATVLKGVKWQVKQLLSWIDKLEEILEKAALEKKYDRTDVTDSGSS